MMSNLEKAAIKLIEKKATPIQLDAIVRQLQGITTPLPDGQEPLESLFSYIEATKGSLAAAESVRSPYDPSVEIDWDNNNCKVSKYFTVGEVTQYDARRTPKGDVIPRVLELASHLDEIREAWGHPVGVTSWYRPPEVNREVGGSQYSQHMQGWAADIYPVTGGTTFDFQTWLDPQWGDALGYGSHRGFVHIDLREGLGFNGEQGWIRWDY